MGKWFPTILASLCLHNLESWLKMIYKTGIKLYSNNYHHENTSLSQLLCHAYMGVHTDANTLLRHIPVWMLGRHCWPSIRCILCGGGPFSRLFLSRGRLICWNMVSGGLSMLATAVLPQIMSLMLGRGGGWGRSSKKSSVLGLNTYSVFPNSLKNRESWCKHCCATYVTEDHRHLFHKLLYSQVDTKVAVIINVAVAIDVWTNFLQKSTLGKYGTVNKSNLQSLLSMWQ